jgi:hypothetical protein
MTRFIILALIATFGMVATASAQPYGPASVTPPEASWNPWLANRHSSTELEGALTGGARWLHGRGLYNQLTADAFNRWQEGYSKYLQNEEQRVNTYFKLKQINADYRAAKYPVPLTKEKLDQWNLLDQPDRLTPAQYNTDTGMLRWPALLRVNLFDDERLVLEEVFARRSADEFGPDSEFYRQVAHSTQILQGRLKGYLRGGEQFFTDEEYVAAQKFLSSLVQEARFAPTWME